MANLVSADINHNKNFEGNLQLEGDNDITKQCQTNRNVLGAFVLHYFMQSKWTYTVRSQQMIHQIKYIHKCIHNGARFKGKMFNSVLAHWFCNWFIVIFMVVKHFYVTWSVNLKNHWNSFIWSHFTNKCVFDPLFRGCNKMFRITENSN